MLLQPTSVSPTALWLLVSAMNCPVFLRMAVELVALLFGLEEPAIRRTFVVCHCAHS